MAWSMRLARWISMCLIADPQAAAFGQVGNPFVFDDVVAVLVDAGRRKAAHEFCPVGPADDVEHQKCPMREPGPGPRHQRSPRPRRGWWGGCRMVAVIKSPFVVKVFFVVAGPGAASTGSGSWLNWLLRLPPAPARSRRTPLLAEDPRVASAQAGVVDPPRPCRLPISRRHPPLRWSWSSNLPFAIRGFRHRAGVVAAAASDTRGGGVSGPDRSRPCPVCSRPAGARRGSGPPRRGRGSLTASWLSWRSCGAAAQQLVVAGQGRRGPGRSAPRTPSGPPAPPGRRRGGGRR